MNVLIDNTTFAGAMRILRPELDAHVRYVAKYPDFKEVDVLSFCEFLTGIVLYNQLKMETSSTDLGKDIKEGSIVEASAESWVESLKKYLPAEVSNRISSTTYSPFFDEDDAIQRAYEILASSWSDSIKLKRNEKIPDAYYSKDYVYRENFERINKASNNLLSEGDLVQAMFLHRGIFLQAVANDSKSLYMPHYYRGKMLYKLPPSIIQSAPTIPYEYKVDYEFRVAKIPTKDEISLTLRNYGQQLNKFYFELVQKSSWAEYSTELPFIGLAIYESVKRNPYNALEVALYYSEKSQLKHTWNDLEECIEKKDRPKAEKIVESIKNQLLAAAGALGVQYENTKSKSVWKLITSSIPVYGKAIESLADILPDKFRNWGREFASQFISNTPVQSLLISHVNVIRS